MLLTGQSVSFNYHTGNVINNRPVAVTTPCGTTITPGNNTMGSWTEILAPGDIDHDCYRILLCINANSASVNNRSSLMDIGIDVAGGTSYTTIIPYLLCGSASNFYQIAGAAGGIWYEFFIKIPAGSSLAARASVNNATVGTMSVAVWLQGKVSNLHMLRFGTGVEAIGTVAASSKGTDIVLGTTSEGAYTLLGTTTHDCWGWQGGFNQSSAAMSANTAAADFAVGDGTDFVDLIRDLQFTCSTAELITTFLMPMQFREVAAGSSIYMRGQSSGGALTYNGIAYGVY